MKTSTNTHEPTHNYIYTHIYMSTLPQLPGVSFETQIFCTCGSAMYARSFIYVRVALRHKCPRPRSVLRCVAVCCGVLQCVAVCFRVLRCVAVGCGVLQCGAVCCSVVQCVICNALQHTATLCSTLKHNLGSLHIVAIAARCNTLQHTAPCGSRDQ